MQFLKRICLFENQIKIVIVITSLFCYLIREKYEYEKEST